MVTIDEIITAKLNEQADRLNHLLRFGRIKADAVNLVTYELYVSSGETVDNVLNNGAVRQEINAATVIFSGVVQEACKLCVSSIREFHDDKITRALEMETKKRKICDMDEFILPGLKNSIRGTEEGKEYSIGLSGNDTYEGIYEDLVVNFRVNPALVGEYLDRWQKYATPPVDKDGFWVQTARREEI